MNRTERRLLSLQIEAESCQTVRERQMILSEIRAMKAILRELSASDG